MDTGFSGGSDRKKSACNAGNPGSVPGLGRSPGEGNGYRLQYSCLENLMDRGACHFICGLYSLVPIKLCKAGDISIPILQRRRLR